MKMHDIWDQFVQTDRIGVVRGGSSSSSDVLQDERRRRVFWCVFMADLRPASCLFERLHWAQVRTRKSLLSFLVALCCELQRCRAECDAASTKPAAQEEEECVCVWGRWLWSRGQTWRLPRGLWAKLVGFIWPLTRSRNLWHNREEERMEEEEESFERDQRENNEDRMLRSLTAAHWSKIKRIEDSWWLPESVQRKRLFLCLLRSKSCSYWVHWGLSLFS